MKITNQYTTQLAGQPLSVTFSDLNSNVESSVLIEHRGTLINITLCVSDGETDKNYFPLTVDYEEKHYSVGGIFGNKFTRREGRPSDGAILKGRAIDRCIRPLFDNNIKNEIQIVATTLAVGDSDPTVIGIIGSSIAINNSSLPWSGPLGAFEIGIKGNKILPFPLLKESVDSLFTICGKNGGITMIEAKADQVEESKMKEILEIANTEISELENFQIMIQKECGKEKRVSKTREVPENVKTVFEKEIQPKLDTLFEKKETRTLEKSWKELSKEFDGNYDFLLEEAFDSIVHKEGLKNEKRIDGRKMDEIRPLFAQAGEFSKQLHGTGLFYRGGTHVLSILTLASQDKNLYDSEVINFDAEKRFYHHYNFLPYSTGEVKRIGGTGRREVGHGALVEKSFLAVLPSEEEFPYAMRVVSECMSSNGSTSMGSVCGTTLALMDGGVPIKNPVAGIAMGLLSDGKEYKILTDIQGAEDHYGDMDLKVAGTKNGITGMQMDIKIEEVPTSIILEAIDRAKVARMQILDVIKNAIDTPRESISESAPYLTTVKIKPQEIGKLIGSGGKTINQLRTDFGVNEISVNDDGLISIAGPQDNVIEVKNKIEEMFKELEIGSIVEGKVVSITDFGFFLDVPGEKDGLLHVSEISKEFIKDHKKLHKIGDTLQVVVKSVDNGKIALSLKDLESENKHNARTRTKS